MEWSAVIPNLTGLAHLATAGADGTPHVAVVAPAVEGGQLWFGTRRSSAKARNIAARPAVALMWTPGAEAYLWGRARLVQDLATKQRVWTSGIFPYDLGTFFGSADDADFVFVEVVPTRVTVLAQSEDGIQRQRWFG